MMPTPLDAGLMLLCCAAVLAGFAAARALSLRLGNPPLASPVLVTTAGLLLLLWALGVPAARFAALTAPLRWMLGPALVAMAAIILRSRPLLRRRPLALLGAALAGTAAGIGSAVGMARLLGLTGAHVAGLATKTVTTPFAVVIQAQLHGPVALAAALSVVTGIIGTLLVPPLLARLRFTDPAARGLALGASAHIVATDWLLRREPEAAGMSALILVIVGLMASVVLAIWG